MKRPDETAEPSPSALTDWLEALQEFADNVTGGRQRPSPGTRRHIGRAVRAFMNGLRYDTRYVTISSSRDSIYATVQLSALDEMLALLERAKTSAIGDITVGDVPDQQLRELSIRIRPRPTG